MLVEIRWNRNSKIRFHFWFSVTLTDGSDDADVVFTDSAAEAIKIGKTNLLKSVLAVMDLYSLG